LTHDDVVATAARWIEDPFKRAALLEVELPSRTLRADIVGCCRGSSVDDLGREERRVAKLLRKLSRLVWGGWREPDPIIRVDHDMWPVHIEPGLWSIIDGESWLTWMHTCRWCYEVRITQVRAENPDTVRLTIVNRGDPELAEVYCIVRGEEENDD
jgi:hypothetical protein